MHKYSFKLYIANENIFATDRVPGTSKRIIIERGDLCSFTPQVINTYNISVHNMTKDTTFDFKATDEELSELFTPWFDTSGCTVETEGLRAEVTYTNSKGEEVYTANEIYYIVNEYTKSGVRMHTLTNGTGTVKFAIKEIDIFKHFTVVHLDKSCKEKVLQCV